MPNYNSLASDAGGTESNHGAASQVGSDSLTQLNQIQSLILAFKNSESSDDLEKQQRLNEILEKVQKIQSISISDE